MPQFISVPCKKGFDIKFKEIISNYVRETYGDEQCESHQNAFSEFGNMRNKMLNKTFDKHVSAIEALTRYHDQFTALEFKIPMAENGVRIDFKWEDAFSKDNLFGKKSYLKIASGAYERICILYNIAALYSQVAETQNLNDESGLKAAVKYYQQASGIFSYLKASVPQVITNDPTLDLNIDTLSTLSSLMLAQAQELIYLKSVRDQKKEGLIAKITQQLADLYADSLKLMQLSSVKAIWPKEWVPLVAGKQAGYHAMAEYYQGKECGNNQSFGEQIGRFKQALELMKTSNSRAGSKFLFKTENESIKRDLESVERENNMIYHDTVPNLSSLSPVGKLAIAKEIPPENPINKDFTDLFVKIVPLALHSAVVMFENKKKEMFNAEIFRLKEASETLSGIMVSMNLPAAVEDCKDNEIPESLITKAAKVRESGGIKRMDEMLNFIPDLIQRNSELLNESIKMLDDEEESDKKLREQFKERWGRTPSTKLTESWRNEINVFLKKINAAKASDETVRQTYNKHSNNIRMLSENESDMKQKLPKSTGGQDGNVGSTNVMDELRKLCKDVEELKETRKLLIQEVQAMDTNSLTTTFTKALSEDGSLDVQDFTNKELNTLLTPFRERVRESISEQEIILNKIQEKATQMGVASNSGRGRSAVISSLLLSADKYSEIIGNLEEGQKFYADLTEILLKFQNKVQDFCFARKTEKDELMKDLQNTIVRERTDPVPDNQTYAATSSGTGREASTGTQRPPADMPQRPPPTYNSASESTKKNSTAPPVNVANSQPGSVPQNLPYNPSYNMPPPGGYMPGVPQPVGYMPQNQYQPGNPYGGYPAYGMMPPLPPMQYGPGAPPQQQQQQQQQPMYHPGTYPYPPQYYPRQ